MKANFIVPTPHETNLPALDQIQYTGDSGELKGGWWCVSEAPQDHTVIVCVDTTEAMLDTMAADPKYLFLEDVPDGET